MLEEIAKKYDMTQNSLRFLIRRGIIQKVPTDKDMDFLASLSRIWNDQDWLKISLRRGIRSKARREKFIRELDLTKPERYVLNRYLNAKGRLSVKQVAGEVSTYYGLPEGIAKGVIKKMRGRAYMAKHRKKPEKGGWKRVPQAESQAAALPGGRHSLDDQTASSHSIFG